MCATGGIELSGGGGREQERVGEKGKVGKVKEGSEKGRSHDMLGPSISMVLREFV